MKEEEVRKKRRNPPGGRGMIETHKGNCLTEIMPTYALFAA